VTELTQEIVRRLLWYEPETGKLFWLPRTEEFVLTKNNKGREVRRWNARYANKEAFTGYNQNGYRIGLIFRKTYSAARIIWFYMTGEWPETIDHKNRIRDDNRWGNLRNASRAENMRNIGKRVDNSSGKAGVKFNKNHNKWYWDISYNGQRFSASCNSYEEAVEMREIKQKEYEYFESMEG
jgi:hypothetical protein